MDRPGGRCDEAFERRGVRVASGHLRVFDQEGLSGVRSIHGKFAWLLVEWVAAAARIHTCSDFLRLIQRGWSTSPAPESGVS
jgi:hypothetical protein